MKRGETPTKKGEIKMNCTHCQNKIALHTEFCPHCGTKQEHVEEFQTNEVFEAADEMNEILEIMQIAEYKKSRRKLFIRVTTSVLFLLAGLILSISGGDLLPNHIFTACMLGILWCYVYAR